MDRFGVVVAASLAIAAALTLGVAGCGTDPGRAAETLPAIVTTSSTTTTTTTPFTGRKFYEVKRGENLNMIADAFQVTAESIAELNGLADGGQYLEVGQVLQIPTDILVVDELPTSTPSSAP